MSDTPRTDDFLAHRGHDGIEQFTRGMERENAKLRALLQECRDEIEGLDHGEGAPGMSSYQREMVRDLDLVLANNPVTDAEPSTPASTRAQGPRSV